MIEEVPSLGQLIKILTQVPCLASKNIYRVASHFLNMDNERLEQFCGVLLHAKARIVRCNVCFFWQEADSKCPICASPKRDQSIVCVVESWHELLSIEKTGGYHGGYHVLGGVICPIEGIGPDDLTIEPLIRRVTEGSIKELILAMNATPEGEATASYIAHKLKGIEVHKSCLARGVPVGSSLEYMDRLTLHKAMSERRPF